MVQPAASTVATNVVVDNETYVSSPVKALKIAYWRLVHTNLKTLILLILVALAAFTAVATVFGIGAFATALGDESSTGRNVVLFGLGLLLIIIMTFGSLIFQIATDYLFARSQNNQTVTVKQSLVRGSKRLLVFIGAGIIAAIMVILGFLLLIIPGIYLLLRLSYLYPVIANEDVGPIEAIKRSFALTKGNLWEIIGAIGVLTVVNITLTIVMILISASGSVIVDIMTFALTIVLSFGIYLLNALLFFRYHQSDLQKQAILKRKGTNSLNYAMLGAAILALFVYFIFAVSFEPQATGPSSSPFDFDFDTKFEQTNET